MESHKRIQAFIDSLLSAIETAPGAPCITEIPPLLSGLRGENIEAGAAANDGIPALVQLPFAIRNAQSGPPEICALANCLQAIAGNLPWYQRQEPALPDFMRGHANAFIIGPQGLEQRCDIVVGVSLLAPGIEYPDHNHPPKELYVVMSDGDWRQNSNPWQAPGLGSLVFNPANITHSMRSGPKPLLAIWCLWTQGTNTISR